MNWMAWEDSDELYPPKKPLTSNRNRAKMFRLISKRKGTKVNSKKEVAPKKKNIKLKATTQGILELFVVCSIAYSTTVIALGTEGYISVALTAPAVLWAGLVLVKRFTR